MWFAIDHMTNILYMILRADLTDNVLNMSTEAAKNDGYFEAFI